MVGTYLLKRIIGAFVVMWAIITITFMLMHAIPGGPFTEEKKLPPQIKATIEATYHLNDPVWVQYTDYMKHVVQFDLAQLGLGALVFAVIGGVAAGIGSALKPNTWLDYIITFGSTLGISVPTFIIGALLVYWLGFVWPIFPVALWKGPAYMVLPILTLGAQPMAFIARLTRSTMLDVLQQEYIKTARAKGLSNWDIIMKHALGNAILPVLTYLGPLAAALLTGSFIVETIFAIPGLGKYFVTSIYNRDYTVILGVTIFYSALVVGFNLLVDLLYPLVDPRVTMEEEDAS